ncbi:hypothetical protein [Pedobacter duraquae]|uniref:Uncharacterized protein n=1 Tax=Pedobacter duraquae TaxID=425511 RepID=A0A4R6IH36_9SPHI|nr:hypothetical protein [Pedobacter duraquae]TDO20325.1 hypothetical protein CLV32_4085 [Pedobacter duraquae]
MENIRVVVVENQFTQFEEIHQALSDFNIFPENDIEAYKKFTNNVRILLNPGYGSFYTKDLLRYICYQDFKKYIIDNRIQIILLDHILVNSTFAENGINLVIHLRDDSDKRVHLPVVFFSASNRASKEIEDVMGDYLGLRWHSKVYTEKDKSPEDVFKSLAITIRENAQETMGAAVKRIFEDLTEAINKKNFFPNQTLWFNLKHKIYTNMINQGTTETQFEALKGWDSGSKEDINEFLTLAEAYGFKKEPSMIERVFRRGS